MLGNPEHSDDLSFGKDKDGVEVQAPPLDFHDTFAPVEQGAHDSPLKRVQREQKKRRSGNIIQLGKPATPEETDQAIKDSQAHYDEVQRVLQIKQEQLAAAKKVAEIGAGYARHAEKITNEVRVVREVMGKISPARKMQAMRKALDTKPHSEEIAIDRLATRFEVREGSSLGALQRRATEEFLGGAKLSTLPDEEKDIVPVPQDSSEPFVLEKEPEIDLAKFKRS